MLNPGPQAEAPANEGAARVGGEPPSFQYPHCDRVLTTASGRGLHVRRAHLAEFNNAINIERVHAQWSLEEKFDGELEADAIRRGGERFMNQYLVLLVPRSLWTLSKGSGVHPITGGSFRKS
jgi:hypothetical protein